MKLILEHGKNPDIDGGGYWTEPEDPKLAMKTVATLSEAQSEFIAWRDRNGLGGGNMTKRSGQVWKDAKTMVGRFSYNARLWDAAGKELEVTNEVPA
jgi:hypothetical protein